MRILHIINTLEIGGAQSVLYHLLSGWHDSSDQQKVISLKERGHLSNKVKELGVSLIHLDVESGKANIRGFVRLLTEIRDFHPDVIQTWLYHSDLLGGLMARLVSRAPIIWGVHHTTSDENSVKTSTWQIIRVLSTLSLHVPVKIICCSHSAFDAHLAIGYPRQKMTVIENGINTEQFKPDNAAGALLRQGLGLSDEMKMIGMFARYHPQKDYSTLICAAAVLVRRIPNIHFVLAGSRVDMNNSELVKDISRRNLETSFHLLGKRTDMPFLMAAVDVFTLTASFGEAMPQTIGEAMASGTPCVVTDVGDAAYLVGSSGIVVKRKDPNALADAWQSFLALSEIEYLEKSKQARDRVTQHFSIEQMIADYKNVYHNL